MYVIAHWLKVMHSVTLFSNHAWSFEHFPFILLCGHKHVLIYLMSLQAVKFPKNAYIYLQDLLGKSFDNPLVQRYRER